MSQKTHYLGAFFLASACVLVLLAWQPEAPPPSALPVTIPSRQPAPHMPSPVPASKASKQFFEAVAAAPAPMPAAVAPAPLLPSAKKIKPVGYSIAQLATGSAPAQGRLGDSVGLRAGDQVGARPGDLH